jgi:hypothetical protein
MGETKKEEKKHVLRSAAAAAPRAVSRAVSAVAASTTATCNSNRLRGLRAAATVLAQQTDSKRTGLKASQQEAVRFKRMAAKTERRAQHMQVDKTTLTAQLASAQREMTWLQEKNTLSHKATDLQLRKQCEEVQLFRNRVDLHDKESVRVAARNKREVSRLQREIAMSKEETAEQRSHAAAQRAVCRKQRGTVCHLTDQLARAREVSNFCVPLNGSARAPRPKASAS